VHLRLHVLLLGFALSLGCQQLSRLEMPVFPGQGLSDEEQIAAILDDVQVGMEAERLSKVMAHVSEAYMDEQGRDYAAIRQYLEALFKDYGSVTVRRVNPQVVVQGDEARAVDTFATTAEPMDPTKTPPIDVQGELSVFLRREQAGWKIVKWSPLH
jgi:hypothetical protein